MEIRLWEIQYTPRAAGMMNAKYTLISGIMYIMVLVVPAPGPSMPGCCFMVMRENSSWLPPASRGMRIMPMTAGADGERGHHSSRAWRKGPDPGNHSSC